MHGMDCDMIELHLSTASSQVDSCWVASSWSSAGCLTLSEDVNLKSMAKDELSGLIPFTLC
jgi:hypothetical protein